MSLAGALRAKDCSVALLDANTQVHPARENIEINPSSLLEIRWNRASVLSAKTVLLEAKNNFSSMDQAVLFFDVAVLHEAFPSQDAVPVNAVTESCIVSYMVLVNELVALFDRQQKGRIVFVLKTSASTEKNIPVSVAEAAFIRLAEETANTVSSLLVRLETPAGSSSLTPAAQEQEQLSWLVDQMLQPALQKNQNRWLKAGSRGLFGIL